jgi:uncharacterized protein YqeY
MLIDQITADIKTAMINKEKDRLDALRGLKALLIENKTSRNPVSELDVAINCVKKLKGSLENFPEGHEIGVKTKKEIEYLSAYLPKELSSTEVTSMIQEILAANPALNQGLVMKELSPKIKGQFDSKEALELIKKALGL